MASTWYKPLRKWAKDPKYQAAVKSALHEEEYDALIKYYNTCSNNPTPDDWKEKHSNGHVIRADCRHVILKEDAVTTLDQAYTYCPDCASEYFVSVEDTLPRQRGLYHRDDVYLWRDGEFRLEEEEEEEEEEDYDDDDRNDDDDGLLQPAYASIVPLAHDHTFITRPYGDFLMGIELEVESRGSRAYDIDMCDGYFNQHERYAMFKRDGSLDDRDGFEIVTAARRLPDHLKMFQEWTISDSLSAWNANSSCGMHVHIDSRAFSPLHLGKFLQFYNDFANKNIIKAIAGRHPANDSSARNYARETVSTGKLTPVTIKACAGNTRYYMVNLTNLTSSEKERLKQTAIRDCKGNYSTVEIRIFRASLKKTRLLAQFEFAHASVCFTREAAIHELNGRGFIDFLTKNAGKYKHLARWFGVFIPKTTKQRPHQVVPEHTPAQLCA